MAASYGTAAVTISADASTSSISRSQVSQRQETRNCAPSWSWTSLSPGRRMWRRRGCWTAERSGTAPPLGETIRSVVEMLDVVCTPVEAASPLGSL